MLFLQDSESSMEEKKDKSDDPVVDLFPDDDADDRAGKTRGGSNTLPHPHHTPFKLLCNPPFMLTHTHSLEHFLHLAF